VLEVTSVEVVKSVSVVNTTSIDVVRRVSVVYATLVVVVKLVSYSITVLTERSVVVCVVYCVSVVNEVSMLVSVVKDVSIVVSVVYDVPTNYSQRLHNDLEYSTKRFSGEFPECQYPFGGSTSISMTGA
jgi:hypothetical protein